jgi:hypothetical protein
VAVQIRINHPRVYTERADINTQSSEPLLQLACVQHIGQLGLPICAPFVIARLTVEICEPVGNLRDLYTLRTYEPYALPIGECVCNTRDINDSRWRRLAQILCEQIRELEMSEMICSKLQLVSVNCMSQWAGHHSRIIYLLTEVIVLCMAAPTRTTYQAVQGQVKSMEVIDESFNRR